MAIAQGQTGRPGSRGPGWARAMPHVAAAVVLVVGLGISVTLAVVTARGHARTNAKLLTLQTRLISDAVGSAQPLYIEDHLGGAASLAAATNGDAAAFRRGLAGTVTARGPFAAASLWRVGTAGPPTLVAQVGGGPLLAPASARTAALVRQAAAGTTFVVTKITAGRQARLGYAVAATAATGAAGRYVTYAEEPLPASRVVPLADPAATGLNIAVYLGRAQTRAALVDADSAAALPLRGTVATSRIAFGSTVLTLTASARTSLNGSLGVVLPWAAAIGGTLITVLAALLAEILVRRRVSAERLTGEMGRLYVEQRSVAETLQNAILPKRLPDVPGMQIAVRYLPGVEGTDVGGDWYDVVPLDDGRFVFVVGDVSGRGVRAAAVMASLHYASRAYALEGHPPAVILDQLTRTMDLTRDGHFATVLCGLVDVGTHEITLASAGHLPPLLCGDRGASLVPAKPGSPIGIPGLSPFEPAMVTTAARDTLIAYTDGLVERRGETLDEGMQRLRDVATRGSAPLEDLLSSIVTELTGDAPTDDIALIGLRWLN